MNAIRLGVILNSYRYYHFVRATLLTKILFPLSQAVLFFIQYRQQHLCQFVVLLISNWYCALLCWFWLHRVDFLHSS